MDNWTFPDICAFVLGCFSALLLIANTAEKIAQIIRAAKAPNEKQDERIESLEKRMDAVDRKLDNDQTRLDGIGDGEGVIQRALLALLDHALDGNNIEQMTNSKKELMSHLTNKK